MTAKPTCSARMRTIYGPCTRAASVERDGKPYCFQHDPVRIRNAKRARWLLRLAEIRREEADREAKIERSSLERSSGIDKLSNDQLVRIIELGGIEAMIRALDPNPAKSDNP